MDQFQERLERLSELGDDELMALEEEMVAAFDAADSSADLETMSAIADALDEVRREKSTRSNNEGGEEANAEPPAVEAVPASAAVAEPEVAEAEAEAEAAVETETPEAEAPEEAPVAEETVESDTATEEAGEPNEQESEVGDLTSEDVPDENSPVADSTPAITIRAGGDIPGLTAGTQLSDMDAVVDAIGRKVGSMRGISGDGEHIIVASMKVEEDVPEERMLYPGDMNGNSRKIRALITDQEALQQEALVAAAWCAPRSPIYDIPTMGTTVRPLRDALPTFNADRGGITWMEPPTFPDFSAASAIWRYDEDSPAGWGSYANADGSGSKGETKPCLTIECGEEATADVDALTLCLCFNNLTSRAFPEWIRANTDLTMVAQARFAEQFLLSQMFAVATTGTCGTPATSVGAARDFLFTVRAAATSLRWSLRIGPDAPLQLAAPSWVRDAIAIDLGLQAPGEDKLSVSYSEVDGYLRDMGLTAIWFTDDIPNTAGFTDCAFPTDAHWLLFPTGTFIRLDSGELNLGVVRTKEDLQKNAYCEFSETFETLAYMGPADKSWIVRGLTAINLFGATGAPIDLTA